ncbi:MAG: hypothetical protein ABSG36_08660 [Acidimicrobiales bacterium]|jgi:hypothetical protein
MTRRLAIVAIGLLVAIAVAAGAGGGATATAATSASSLGATSKTKTIIREFLVNGTEQVVDKRTVTLDVSQTLNLRGRQEINVSWSGAHPTGGIVADQNSIGAQQEEYPFVLLECRGIDSTSVKALDQLSPETCWTQNWSEHYQDSFQSDFPPYRLDQFASVANRAQVVGAPSPLPSACNYLPAPTQHWVPFVAASGHVYYGGPAGCAGEPPEAQDVETQSSFPSNETFGVTGLDGKGSTDFDVWTSAENASLGCSQTVPCALVAVPIMGISCDATDTSVPAADQPTGTEGALAVSQCEEEGAFAPGQLVNPVGDEDLSVSGSLWWSPSNWRHRITVPLSFAVPASACDIVTSKSNVLLYGSELMVQATGQWAPYFCLNAKLFSFDHVQTGEPEARNLLATASSQAALTSYAEPGGYGRPVVNAPVAVTGFAISYVIDGANGQPYTRLRLTPLLLAKLLTESYPAELPIQEEDPALAHNPLNITLDPEFIQLNPGITKGVVATEAASELVALSSDSDVIEALTTYINDNAEARAWLNGKPDPWGMVVNPAYKGIKLPVDQWPLLSDFEPAAYYASDNNDCLYNSPVPYLPLVAAPMDTLEDISEAIQFAIANSTTVCSQIDGTSLGEKLVALGAQTVGYRFMIGVTPLADDARYQLRAAALETTDNSFVVPDNASLRAAAAVLKPDAKTGTWPISYPELSKSSTAYPGTMVVYAAIPTSGLPAVDASDYASLLQFAATTGQTPGLGVGQLPPGYLPMTEANGLGALANYTWAVAADVAAQNGQVPLVTADLAAAGSSPTTTTTVPATTVPATTVPPTTVPATTVPATTVPATTVPATTVPPTTVPATIVPTTTVPPTTVPATTIPPTTVPATTVPATTVPPTTVPATTVPATTVPPTTVPPTTVPSSQVTGRVALGRTVGVPIGTGGRLVVLILLLGLAGLVGVPVTFIIGRRRGRW